MSEESDISSEEYVPLEEDFDSSDDLSSGDLSDEISEDETKERKVEGGWTLLPNVFEDQRPEPRPLFDDDFSGINPVQSGKMWDAISSWLHTV